MAAPRLLVACLCAAWCGSCRDYRPVFDALAAQMAGEADFAWVDIEDHADHLGELDIDNFPTLMIAAGDELRFLGPVAPLLAAAARLVRHALASDAPGAVDAQAPADLPARVRALRAGIG